MKKLLMIAVFFLWGCINLGTWIDLNNIFDNRQGYGTQLNIEECLHEPTDVIITNDLYQQLISALNKYYNDTNQIVTDLNNNVNFVKDELDTTNENVSVNRESIQNILSELVTIRNNIQTNADNINNNHNEINNLNTLIASLNTQINNVDNKYQPYKNNIAIVTNDSELRQALANNIGVIFIKGAEIFNPTESYEVPANTRIIGINYPTFNCSYSETLNNIFRNKLDGTEGEYNGSGNITIEGLNFLGNNHTKAITVIGFAHSDKVKIKNCKFDGFNTWHNIEINSSRNVVIEDCVFTNFGQNIANPTEVIQLDLPNHEGTYPWACKMDNTPCRNITIRNNQFFNIATGTGVIGEHTYVQGYRHENIVIENNVINDVDNFVYLLGTQNLKVLNNHGSNVFNFMYFGNANHNSQDDTEVSGNVIFFKQTYKVKPPEPSGYVGKFIYPIHSSSATSTIDNNLIITNNRIAGCKDHAITVCANRVVITGNVITDVAKHSIYVWGGNRVIITGNVIFNNNAEGVHIMMGNNANIPTVRVICQNNVGSVGTGSNFTSDYCIVGENQTN